MRLRRLSFVICLKFHLKFESDCTLDLPLLALLDWPCPGTVCLAIQLIQQVEWSRLDYVRTVHVICYHRRTIPASRIHISWSCRDNLLAANEGFEIKERGKVELKGKGELFTYWLCGKDDYDRPLPDWDAEDGPSHGLKIDDYLNVRITLNVYFIK